jgi:hypothetical protein
MPRSKTRAIVLAAATLLGLSGASAQPGQLDNVAACRLDPQTVHLRFTFEGGACQQPGEAIVEDAGGGIGNVTVPTEDTAEICTMQIVPVEFAGELPADMEYTTFDITVLATDGERVQALGSAGIIDDGPECEANPAE